MKNKMRNRRQSSEGGVALFIALIALLLISGVAVAMIVASGSESAINGNYRSSSSAYYASLAGLEEGRGRLLPNNPNTLVGVANTGIPAFNVNMAVTAVTYISNPLASAGETVNGILTPYPDTEYDAEFGAGKLAAATKSYVQSQTGTNNANIPGPMFKWVRINPVTEKALNTDVNRDGTLDAASILYYDTATTPPSLTLTASSSTYQALEVTSMAVLPNGSEKLMQYLVTPQVFNLNFPAALEMAGTVGSFSGANSNPYQIQGADGQHGAPPVPGCNPNQPTVAAIGVSASADTAIVTAGLPRPTHYTGTGGTPSVSVAPLNSTLSSPASLNQLVTDLRNTADAVIPNPPLAANVNNSGTTYNYGQAGWPAMSASNPKTVFVDGSFDLGPNTGYGLLVVTGNFHYHGNSGWNGIILVIGDGTTTFDGNGGGNGEFDGAVFVATTRDAAGNPLASFGATNFNISGGGGNGIYYNSCWIKNVQQPPTYKVLSFREIPYIAPGT